MYAVFQPDGRQYKVSQGDVIKVDFFEAPVGAMVTFEKVLMLGGDATRIGKPFVDGASVIGEVLEHGKAPKVLIFKKRRRRANSKTLRGFRARYTAVRIQMING